MQPVAETHTVYEVSNAHFRRRILGADFAHVFGALFWSELVHQTTLTPLVRLLYQPFKTAKEFYPSVFLETFPE